MPTDLQIIDGFERLRSDFIEANPSVEPNGNGRRAPGVGDSKPTLEQALEAWILVALSLDGKAGQERRWLRALVKLLSTPDANVAAAESAESGIAPLLKKNPGLMNHVKDAAERLGRIADGKGRIVLPESHATPAAEAEAWARALPKLGGTRAWRMLQHLGRPVIAPEAHVRRFFWRLGLLEDEKLRTPADAARVMACAERTAHLTGMEIAEIGRLIEWHTRRGQGLKGGGRCGAAPDCEGCPFSAGCMWFRVTGSRSKEAGDDGAREAPAQRLKKRWQEHEPGELDDAELLASLLGGNRAPGGPLEAAEDLIRRFGGLKGIEMASTHELARFKGIGEARARQVKSALELGKRLSLQPVRRGDPITQSHEVWTAFRDRYRHIAQEHFIVLLLDTKNRLIQTHLVSKGSLNSSPAHPREVFKQAIRLSASGVILMHNHPSGDPEPSAEDIAITNQLADAGKILGIRVLDHIILGGEGYYSFRDEGNL